MDLRPYNLGAADVAEAKRVLAYQPFIITDSVITGVAYNWLHADNPEDSRLHHKEVYDREVVGDEVFRLAWDANLKLLRTYESFAALICRLFPGSSYIDVSCNTGYFPAVASLNGMGESAGLDPENHAPAFDFLNRITGSRAAFMQGLYLPGYSEIAKAGPGGITPLGRQFDVVSNLAYLCHVADPLHLLFGLAKLARKAIFVWSGFLESDDYLIRLNDPVTTAKVETTEKGLQELFLQRYMMGTSISTKLLISTMRLLDFPAALTVGYPPDGLPPNWHEKRMGQYQPFRGFLFVREAFAGEVQARLRTP